MTGPVFIFEQWRNGFRAAPQTGGGTWTFTLETNRPLPPFTADELHADNRRKRPSLSSFIISTRLRSGFRVGVHLFVFPLCFDGFSNLHFIISPRCRPSTIHGVRPDHCAPFSSAPQLPLPPPPPRPSSPRHCSVPNDIPDALQGHLTSGINPCFNRTSSTAWHLTSGSGD